MSKVLVRKNDQVVYTEYDAYFTIIRGNDNRVFIPYCEQPELMDKATTVSAFRWEI